MIGARAAFSYGSSHWFHTELGTWMSAHDVSVNAVTNALILMAVARGCAGTVGMAGSDALPQAETARLASADREKLYGTASI